MNRQAFWIVPALALALAAPAAAKDDRNRREKQRNQVMRDAARAGDDWYGARGGRRDLGNRFRGIDRNGDGVITRKEWPGNDKSFNQHDLNRDGILAGREVRAGGRRDTRVDRRTSALGRLDRNRDGVLHEYEWPYGASEFRRLDRNRNRIIESWEYRR
jgi:hypothetical protein